MACFRQLTGTPDPMRGNLSLDELSPDVLTLCGMGVRGSPHPASVDCLHRGSRKFDPCGDNPATFRKTALEPYHWLVLTHLLFFPAAIAAGVIWANPITNPTVPHHPIEAGRRCLDVLMYASFASCIWWVWRMPGFRWLAVSLMLLAEMLVFFGLFISGMSVSGDWL